MLDHHFEELIDSFLTNQLGISNNFFNESLLARLKQHLKGSYLNMKTAGIGSSQSKVYNENVRTDSILWLDKNNNDAETEFLSLIESFIQYLNMTCYAGITQYEFHYSLYESGGFYKKHIDQFKNNSTRKYSMITYLNESWKEADGGNLVVYQNHDVLQIHPTNGKTVFFKSDELLHEVETTFVQRMSITGWLKTE